jgi:hypothetical protein
MTAKATARSSPSQLAQPGRNGAEAGGECSFNWEVLVPAFVHPTKIAILEAMLWIGEPLSATDLTGLFGEQDGIYVGTLSYHLVTLRRVGILKHVHSRSVRGATEKFYTPIIVPSGER